MAPKKKTTMSNIKNDIEICKKLNEATRIHDLELLRLKIFV